MTITLVDVQASIIAKLKASTAVTSLLGDPKEIREVEWIGDKYSFPNIRVRVTTFKRRDLDCDIFNVTANIFVFGENASSKLTNEIASVVYDLMDRSQLKDATVSSVTRIVATQLGADYIEESGVWRSEIAIAFQVK